MGAVDPTEIGPRLPALAFGFHCSVFKKRLPDSRTKRRVEATLVLTTAGSLAVRDADRPEGPRARERRETLVSTGSVVPGPPKRARSGVRGEVRDYRARPRRVKHAAASSAGSVGRGAGPSWRLPTCTVTAVELGRR